MSTLSSAGRRDFAITLGSIVAAFVMPSAPAAAQGQAGAALPRNLQANPRLRGWIRIQVDGTVQVFTGKAELGQGILTALAQIAAEELDVAFSRVRMMGAGTLDGPDEQYTYGSQSVEQSGAVLRIAAAEARAVLVGAAARHLNVPPAALQVQDGVVVAGQRQVSYWELVRQGLASLDVDARGNAVPKRPADYTIVGRPVPRADLPAKLEGVASFIQDMRWPGMLFGRVLLPPSRGAALLAVDLAAVRKMPGVVAVVRDGSFLGVVAAREEQAIAARAALRTSARWSADVPKLPDQAHVDQALRRMPSEDTVLAPKGQEQAAPADARRFEASYGRPYLSHASVAPSCAAAVLDEGKMTVWSHTQGAFPLRGDLAKVLNLPAAQVHVIHLPSSGCYGHNGADDVALDAALLARAVPGRPVKVQWMREDEFSASPLSPAMAVTVRAGVSASGRVVDWDYEVWSNTHAMRPGQPGGINLLSAWHLAAPHTPSPPLRIPQPFGDGDRNAVPLYDFPRQRITNHLLMQMPIRTSSLRTLGGHANVFAIECFMDEVAAGVGADPVAFKREHLRDPRCHAVIDAVVAAGSWRAGEKGRDGRGRGFAFARYKNIQTYAAVIVDVSVDAATGVVKVLNVLAAIDVGRVINPDGVRSQIEGGILQSISWTLKEAVSFNETTITSRDWSGYPVMNFSEMPPVEVILIDRPEEPPLGAGEGALGPASAAVANAFAHATGRRMRHLPMTPPRVKQLLG
jgi:nicotinate dehydrogenase subunit B